MKSLWESNIDPKNPTSLLNCRYIFQRDLDLSTQMMYLGVCRSKGSKVTNFQSRSSKKKSVSWPCPTLTSPPRFDSDLIQTILKVWRTVILQPFDLQTPKYLYGKILTSFWCRLGVQEGGYYPLKVTSFIYDLFSNRL